MVVGTKSFDKLDKATQAAVLKVAAAAGDRGSRISEEKNNEYLKELAKQGVAVDAEAVKLKAELKNLGARMVADWQLRAGPEGKAIIGAYYGK